jgi:NDP-sugar pyrophosphorylase family protein
MKVILLAGGISKRFWPLTSDKNLWSFYPDCLFTHNLKVLKEIGLTDIVVVINPKSVEEAKKLASDLTLEAEFIVQEEAKGMGEAVLLAKDNIKNDSVLVLNCDDVVEKDLLQKVITLADQKATDLILVGKKFETYFDGGYLKVEGSRAVGVVEKPGEGNEPSQLVKLVVDYFQNSQDLIDAISGAQTEKDDQYEVAINQLLQTKSSEVVSYEGLWLTVKYPWHLLDMLAFFLKGITQSRISENADISPRAIIDGPVVIEDGVKIFENAKVRGPAYIGKGVVVANNAMVRESYIGEGSVVGFGSEVARSYLGADCWTHTNFVGDSILQKNVSFGVGTVLTNLKLDEGEISSVVKGTKLNTGRVKLGAIIGENVRIGSNSTLMPGVKIGSDSFVGAGVCVKEDLEEKQFLYLSQEQVKKANNRADSMKSRDSFKGKI